MLTKLLKLALAVMCCSSLAASAQISSPDLGEAQTANWLAMGWSKNIPARRPWKLISYVGLGFKSRSGDVDPWSRPAILVLNQEVAHAFSPHWEYAGALSYRRTNVYRADETSVADGHYLEQELRAYGKVSYKAGKGRWHIKPTLRQEFRKFYLSGFRPAEEDFQLRLRARMQISWNIRKEGAAKLIFNAEHLFASSRTTEGWTSFAYDESRFSLYYSLPLGSLPVTFDIGYMNVLMGKGPFHSVHYLAVDFIWHS